MTGGAVFVFRLCSLLKEDKYEQKKKVTFMDSWFPWESSSWFYPLSCIVITLKSGNQRIETASALGTPGGEKEEESVDAAGSVQAEPEAADTGPAQVYVSPDVPQKVKDKVKSMSLEEKAAQLFFVTPEAITQVDAATVAGEDTKKAYEQYPVGGIIYFSRNIQGPDQLKEMLSKTQNYAKEIAGVPVFLGVDEEGGEVSRVAGNKNFSVTRYESMRAIGDSRDTSQAYDVGKKLSILFEKK